MVIAVELNGSMFMSRGGPFGARKRLLRLQSNKCVPHNYISSDYIFCNYQLLSRLFTF